MITFYFTFTMASRLNRQIYILNSSERNKFVPYPQRLRDNKLPKRGKMLPVKAQSGLSWIALHVISYSLCFEPKSQSYSIKELVVD